VVVFGFLVFVCVFVLDRLCLCFILLFSGVVFGLFIFKGFFFWLSFFFVMFFFYFCLFLGFGF